MMTSIVQEATTAITATTPAVRPTAATVAPSSVAAATTTITAAIPPHVLIIGKKNAVDYIAPALFRLGSFGELVVKAKGRLSIVTAVNVAEMVKRDVAGLVAKPVRIGTEELVIDGATRRVSYIEIHLAKPALSPAAAVSEQQLAQTAAESKRIRKTASAKKKKTSSAARKKKAAEAPAAVVV
jgi:DNA-binding protein Alba